MAPKVLFLSPLVVKPSSRTHRTCEMKASQVIVLVVLLVSAVASQRRLSNYGFNALSVRPKYDFDYAVKDYFGNDFGQQESRDGYDTQGSYYVQLPDGRLQRVTYYVNGDSGYVAQVSYEGEAQYPAGYRPHATYSPSGIYG